MVHILHLYRILRSLSLRHARRHLPLVQILQRELGRCAMTDIRFKSSVQRWRIVVIAGLEILLLHNLNALHALKAIKDQILVYTACNLTFAVIALRDIQAIWVCFFPERLVIKTLQPFFQFYLVLKFLHGLIVPHLRQGTEVKQQLHSTCGCWKLRERFAS